MTAMSGIAATEARIAVIRSQLASLTARVPGRTPVAVATDGEFAAALASSPRPPASSTAPPAAVPSPSDTPSAALGTSGIDGTSAGDGRALVESSGLGAWARKLPPAGQRWAGHIDEAARSAGVDPALLAALVRHESNFDPNVRSHAGAIGLAQLMPGTAAALGVDPTDPVANLRGGARYLREQLDRFGTPELALAAYNAGPNRVAQAGGIPRIAEAQTYVRRVMSTWEQLR
jgi:soluble lytic murein transglycosylase-like protein